jgi:predicted nuclease of predicted toxin-antitoxin system
MLFLADENIPGPSIDHLRGGGFDVAAMSELDQGASDLDVIARAIHEQRIILTFDKDFGELLFRDAASNPPGVIFFRHKAQIRHGLEYVC